ncbi:MAG TPA: CHAD domain-containing protein [Gemmatimonadales bacterium]|nr:CHAD domain-containing protein [Gemmatimonadales bacterium]
MTDFPAGLLDRPAVEAAGVVALRYLDDAAAAAARLTDARDAEALHDFRVSVRRLRVTLRAYPGLHEGIPRKYRRRLRKLVRATNPVRDAEAQLAWFRDRSGQFTATQRAALGALRSRLRARRRRAQTRTHLGLQQRFTKLERKIRRALAALRSHAGTHEAPFRAIVAATLIKYAMDLRKRLAGASVTSAADLHATRIAAKRLRYLLEPVEQSLVNGDQLIARLKRLQDVFGSLTDAHELRAELQRSANTNRQAGIAAAASLLETEVTGLLATVREEWSTVAGGELETEITAAAQQLRPTIPRRPPPPARRDSRLPAGA